MNLVLALPLEVRLMTLFAVGLVLGGQLNRGIYRLAWKPRRVGPWSLPDEGAPPRRRGDRIPVLGWLFLRRESFLHGAGYWLRPLLIELACGLGLAALYWREVEQQGVVPLARGQLSMAILHAQYLAHVVLISLMIVATFIDFDEQTIPDAITVPGTLAGLFLAALLPASRSIVSLPALDGLTFAPLQVASPAAWPNSLLGPRGLAIALACCLGWWTALVPWTWTTRRGLAKALAYWTASFLRRLSLPMAVLLVLGSAAVLGVWRVGGAAWESLLSALVGVAFGGGLIWAVRVIGTRALGQEAMGFGDVTLMAMIGAFTGWQATLMVFFLAPFAAVLISLTQWVLTGRKDIAFGPYLCLATLYLIVQWGAVWEHTARQAFSLGWLVPALVVICLVLMGGMLAMLRLLRECRSSHHNGTDLGRRNFVSSLATACLAGPALAAGARQVGSAAETGSRIKVGQVGTRHAHAAGKMAAMRRLSELYEVVGIAEPNDAERARWKDHPAYRDLRWMTEEELLGTRGLQAVAVETCVRELVPTAFRCVAAGMHVHLDKPAGESLAEFRRLCDEARRQDRVVQMGYMFRYNPAFQFLFRAVREGWLGDVFEVHGVISKTLDAPARRGLSEYRGGSMFELGCHLIDALVTVLGAPQRVTPYLRRTQPQRDELLDNALAVFEYGKATAAIRSSLLEVDGMARRQFVVCGDRGTVEIRPLEPPALRLTLAQARGEFPRGTQVVVLPAMSGRYDGDFFDLAKIVRGEKLADYGPSHDLTVHEAILRASDLPVDV